jgi:hypothetical protein
MKSLGYREHVGIDYDAVGALHLLGDSQLLLHTDFRLYGYIFKLVAEEVWRPIEDVSIFVDLQLIDRGSI